MPAAQGELILNEKLAKQLVSAANWVKMQSDEGNQLVDILRWPVSWRRKSRIRRDCRRNFVPPRWTVPPDDFVVARETEGQALKALIERLEGVSAVK